jgi:hypothetical protein
MGETGYVTGVLRKDNVYEVSLEESEDKRKLGRHNRRWKNIKVNFVEMGCKMDSCGSEQRPVVDFCEYSNEPSDFIKGRVLFDEVNDC